MFNQIYLAIIAAFSIHTQQNCRLNTRTHFGEPLPIIIRNGRLLEPSDNDGNIDLNVGDELTLSCEGSGTIEHSSATQSLTTSNIFCEGGDNFKNHDWLLSPARFTLFKCQYPPNYISNRTNQTCFDGNVIVQVGYKVQNQFYPTYETCFNYDTRNPIYSQYTQKPYNAYYQTRVERPFFIDDGNYGFPVDSYFSPRGQQFAVAQLVGTKLKDYMTTSQELSRGHLAAKTDFVFAFGERATFHYVNCAPQWKNFNGGNWNTLEVDLRNHIHAAGYNTIIYTGTYGVTQLLNQVGYWTDLHLYTDENNNPVIPIPQYFYKVVYEPSSKNGIAFVGINNPHYTAEKVKELIFCDDVCKEKPEFRWLTWHPNNPNEGYTFCCSIPDFRRAISHLPDFEVEGILI